MALLRRVAAVLADLVYPPTCALCDRTLASEDPDWCPDCAREVLAATATDYCHRCGAKAEPYLVDDDGCKHCRDAPARIDGLARVGPYEGPIGELVRRYKYNGVQRLDRLLGTMLANTIRSQSWCAHLDAMVPVPASFAERWRYQFYPVALLAQAAARELGVPALPLLVVGGKKRRQVELSPSERAANVRGKFRLHRHARVVGARLCLIDDVATSNATIRECAAVLKRAGAAEIYAAVLAKGGADKK